MQARQEILLPVKFNVILITLTLAFVLNLLPWFGVGRILRPDFVALVLLYWCIHQPRKIGFFGAWMLGLLMDVVDASLFGQHALAYSFLAYAAIVMHRRVQNFAPFAQVIYAALVLFSAELIMLMVRLLGGAGLPDWDYFSGILTAALLWPLLGILLKIPRRARADRDSNDRSPNTIMKR